ncbi:Long chain acyl-CoA synthetase 1 [Nymphaea thermarum]|nr:Long chain acyl-CoA synthetase 1 [Nymphaea thermarum]
MRVYAVEVESGKEGKDGSPSVGPVYRSVLSKDGFPLVENDVNTSWHLFRDAVERFPQNKMLGWREIVNGKAGGYVWKTFKEAYEEALQIGSALRSSGAEPGCRVGIYGANCPQWIIAMEACNAHSLICVPLYDTLEKQKEDAARMGIPVHSWDEFLMMGKENSVEISPPKPHDICTIMYTSGTSGEPKGVVLTHETHAMQVKSIDIFMSQFEDKMLEGDCYLSFLPLAHILDRIVEEYFFHHGACVGYWQGVRMLKHFYLNLRQYGTRNNIESLKDDLVELKPTLFAGVPRVFERVNAGMPILYLIKAGMGGRVRLIISGAAPLREDVEEYLRVTSGAFVVQGYGLTETCGMSTIACPDELDMIGTVGVPGTYIEMRLEEVPEMGYSPFGKTPRGEICFRGKTLFSGYYKNPELTNEVFKDGWFHTGDIGELLPNGVLKVIDRKKNIFKLSQGEYIAVENLERIYAAAPIVEDIWVYGDSFQSMLVAVVIPNEEHTKEWGELDGHVNSFIELCALPQLKQHILLELKSAADKNKLRKFEHIKGIIVEATRFEAQPDLLTPTMKKKRAQLLKHYKVFK